MKIVTIWPGHVGKPDPDPGACGPSTCEAEVTGELAAAISLALRRAGVAVADLGAGTYADRAAHADAVGAELVLHVHLDVGEPAIYHYGTAGGQHAGQLLQERLAVVGLDLDLRVATSRGYPRARGLLALTRAPALLLELADVRDATAVELLRTQATEIGRAIAQATSRL